MSEDKPEGVPPVIEELGEGYLEQIQKAIVAYKRELIVVGVIVFGGGLAYSIGQAVQDKAEDKAWVANYEAEAGVEAPSPTELAKRLEAAAKANPDTRAAAYALAQQMKILADDGKNTDALAAARSFRTQFASHALYPSVSLSYAQLLMRAGKYVEAKAVLEPLLKNSTTSASSFLEPEARLALAQCLGQEAEQYREKEDYVERLGRARDAYLDLREGAEVPYSIRNTARFSVVILDERIRAVRGAAVVPDALKTAPAKAETDAEAVATKKDVPVVEAKPKADAPNVDVEAPQKANVVKEAPKATETADTKEAEAVKK